MAFILSLLFLFQQPVAARSSIEGQVTQSDSPEGRPVAIPDARVELTGEAAPKIVRTDREGRFRVADIAPGRYRITVTADGFAAAEYGQPAVNLPGTPIAIRSGEPVPRIDFKLVRAATITGRVYDFDNEPLGGAIVQLFRAVAGPPGPAGPRTTAAAFTRTNDRGEYRFYWITPDEYYVSVNYTSARLGPVFVPPNPNMLRPPNGYPQVYYRDSPDVARAEKLQLKAGEEEEGLRSDAGLFKTAAADLAGTFTLRGIPPGNYVLFAWNFLEPRAYADPAFLRRYEQEAVPLQIEGKGERTIRIRVIMRER